MAKEKIVFFGTEAWGVPVLHALHEHFEIAAVVTRPDARSGRGRMMAASPVKLTAAELSIDVLQPDKPAEIIDQIKEIGARIAVLVAYGRIIPQELIDVFPLGILNVHPSLLPLYRGPAPIENTILDGSTPGISIIRLSAGMDDGDVLDQINLDADVSKITSPELYTLAGKKGAEMITGVTNKVSTGTATFAPQNDSAATYTKMIQKADSNLDLSQNSEHLERHVRAYLGWPGSKTNIENIDVTVTAAHIEDGAKQAPGSAFRTPSGDLALQTADKWLIIDRLKPAGRIEMTGREFLAGHRSIPGIN